MGELPLQPPNIETRGAQHIGIKLRLHINKAPARLHFANVGRGGLGQQDLVPVELLPVISRHRVLFKRVEKRECAA